MAIPENKLSKAIGQIFRTAREQQRLSQEQVAALSEGRSGGISRTMISAIERGRSLPGLEALVVLSRVLNVEPREIIERIEMATDAPVDVTGRTPAGLVATGHGFFAAGEYRKALAHYDAAAELLALQGVDDVETRSQRVWIEIDRSVALRQARALKAAQAAAQRAVELARDHPAQQAEAYMALASVLSQLGMHVLARDIAQRALVVAGSSGPKRQGQAWAQLAGTLYRAGEFEEARQSYVKVRELAVAADDQELRIQVEGNIGSCHMELGRAKQARIHFREAVQLARRYDDASSEAFWLIELGGVAHAERRFDEAESHGRAALRIAKPLEQALTVFRAEWLLHRVVRARDPDAQDRHRLAYMKKLWRKLRDYRSLREIQDFEKSVIAPADRREGAT